MPKWDLGDIMSWATKGVGRRADIDRSDVSFLANQAYADVADRAPHALQEKIAVSSTTSGENRIDLPADFNQLKTASFLTDIGSRRTLRQTNQEWVDAEGFDSVGKPDRFVLYNDWMELHPSPDSAYSLQIRYKAQASTLAAESDVPSLATPWRFPVMRKTQEYLMSEILQDPAGAAAKRNEYLDAVNSLDDTRARRQRASREAYSVQPYDYSPT